MDAIAVFDGDELNRQLSAISWKSEWIPRLKR
jgi:hypothetical protein